MSDFCVKGIYGSGMVLQRNTTNCIFGNGDSGNRIVMEFRGKKYSAIVDCDSSWKIEYNPGEAGGPFLMKIDNGFTTVEFTDVYVGEVWVSSGQSNAQLPMERMKFSYEDEFNLPENPNVRMITIPIAWSFDGEKDTVENPKWNAAGPETLGNMSGTGYFFAKKMAAEMGIPVGIINASQGGSPISAWMNRDSLSELGFNEYVNSCDFYNDESHVSDKQKEVSEAQNKWNNLIAESDEISKTGEAKKNFSELGDDWIDFVVPGDMTQFDSAGVVWIKKEINLTAKQIEHFNAHKTCLWLGTIVDADTVFVNNVQVGITYYSYPPRRYEVPAGVLKEGANTVTVRLLKNSKWGSIRFYEEKPYFLFTDNVKVAPCAFRNVEKYAFDETVPEDGEKISLSGNWKMKVSCKVEDAPAGMFFEWVPTALYNSMLAPCFNYAVAGAVWYQGESDAGRYGDYEKLLLKLMDLWRSKFVYNDKMSFVIIQLPNWSDGHGENSVEDFSDWALLREAQQKAAENAENAAFSVMIDAGEWNDLHPEKKRTGGTRAAQEALRIRYGKDFKSAPVMKKVEIKNSDSERTAIVQFSREVFAENEKNVSGFSAVVKKDGKDKAVICSAVKNGSEIVVSLPSDAVELRYLWAQNPAPVQLYSEDSLPAAPFRYSL